MRFSLLTTVAVLTGSTLAQLPANDVVNNIQVLTFKSRNLIEPAKQLSFVNAPLLLVGQGPWATTIAGFTDIVATANGAISAMNRAGTAKASYVGNDATAIGNAFRIFVEVHKQLLNVIIGKARVLTQLPLVGAPVSAVLRLVEGVVDTIAYALIDGVEVSVASVMKSDYRALSDTVGTAIKQYTV